MIDRKITVDELAKNGLTIENVEYVPALKKSKQAQLRFQKKIPFYKIGGQVFYQVSELKSWIQKQKKGEK